MIWETSPGMCLANVSLRLVKSAVPLATLYIAKEIIDEVIRLINHEGNTDRLWTLVALEFGVVVVSEIMSRAITLLDSLLGDLMSNQSSEKLIRHAATLDLYQFENADFYDKLERARRQTIGRTVLMSMALSQAQEFITVLFLG
ncbi:MAG: ABC transporter ATP-binding protein, partial [Bacteroidota bacterium]